MLLGIPGDNTYANYAEANRTLLAPDRAAARRPHGEGAVALARAGLRRASCGSPDLDQIEALSPEREALWARVERARS